MTLLELYLQAYGTFTETRLALHPGPGLNLVYGANEAGKSTALRALQVLLFDFPHRTDMDFLHDARDLRVGGTLRAADGRELAVVRRKGRKDVLSTPAGESLPDDALQPFLGGVDAERFRRQFGIDYTRLQEGGEELLAGGGELGEALFAAGLGAGVRQVQQLLETEARDLFVGHGSSNARIDQLRREWRELEDQRQEATVPLRRYRELRDDEDGIRQALDRLTGEWGNVAAELDRVERLLRVREALGQWADAKARLAELAAVPLLPEDFGQQVSRSRAELALAAQDRDRHTRRRDELRQALDALVVPQPLLDAGEQVKALVQGLGAYDKAARDRVALAEQQRDLEYQAAAVLADLEVADSLDAAIGRRPEPARRRQIEQLIGERPKLGADLEHARQNLDAAEEQQARLLEELAAIPEPPGDDSHLASAVQAAEAAGDLDRAVSQAEAKVAAARAAVARLAAALPLGPTDPTALLALRVPAAAAIAEFVEKDRDVKSRRQQLHDRQETIRADQRQLRTDLEKLRAGRHVPTPAELDTARRERDARWQAIRANWLDGTALSEPAAATADRFAADVHEADRLADDLREHAGAVERQAGLTIDLAKADERLAEVEQQQTALEQEADQSRQEWQALWAPTGIEPESPGRMTAWYTQYQEVVRAVPARTAAEEQLADLERDRRRLAENLAAALAELNVVTAAAADFATLRHRGRRELDALTAARESIRRCRTQLTALEKSANDRQQAHTAAAEALEGWENQWKAALAPLGLPPTTPPEHVRATLEKLDSLRDLHRDIGKLAERIAGIDTDAERFRETVTALLAALAPDIPADPLPHAVQQLNRRLRAAEMDAANRRQLAAGVAQEEKDLALAETQAEHARIELAEYCRQAEVEDADALPEVAAKSRQRIAAEAEHARLRQELFTQAKNEDLDAFVAAAEAADTAALQARHLELAGRQQELRTSEAELRERLGGVRTVLAGLDSGASAAAVAERQQQTLAALGSAIQDYLRTVLARDLLAGAVERYRQQNETPVLDRAGAFFATLTRGSFTALQTGYDDHANCEVLEAERADRRMLRVGAMSDGTRDQLYLALRLASLEQLLRHGEPMPFIVDDILVQCDDERSRAALEVLDELSETTQVIMFTHHRRLVELAAAGAMGQRLHVQELGGGTA